MSKLSVSKWVNLWKSTIFTRKLQKFQIDKYLTCVLEISKKSSFIIIAPINNDKNVVKINFTRCYLSMLKNVFNFIWLLFEGFNMVKPQYLAITNMHVKY